MEDPLSAQMEASIAFSCCEGLRLTCHHCILMDVITNGSYKMFMSISLSARLIIFPHFCSFYIAMYMLLVPLSHQNPVIFANSKSLFFFISPDALLEVGAP